jgi:hypothetical protein
MFQVWQGDTLLHETDNRTELRLVRDALKARRVTHKVLNVTITPVRPPVAPEAPEAASAGVDPFRVQIVPVRVPRGRKLATETVTAGGEVVDDVTGEVLAPVTPIRADPRILTQERIDEFIARKSDPKWKAPAIPKSRRVAALSVKARVGVEERWNSAAKAAWLRKGVKV